MTIFFVVVSLIALERPRCQTFERLGRCVQRSLYRSHKAALGLLLFVM
jgi:hypothetical protein